MNWKTFFRVQQPQQNFDWILMYFIIRLSTSALNNIFVTNVDKLVMNLFMIFWCRECEFCVCNEWLKTK